MSAQAQTDLVLAEQHGLPPEAKQVHVSDSARILVIVVSVVVAEFLSDLFFLILAYLHLGHRLDFFVLLIIFGRQI